ncbi:hypothetical protein DL95DRAFT_386980 [Leptodontidium sp. 2 PMI_412]|nr:hypothetical protein DL95DRAFT_386980 [Leptodontidium sp. 2 PMI_412]
MHHSTTVFLEVFDIAYSSCRCLPGISIEVEAVAYCASFASITCTANPVLVYIFGNMSLGRVSRRQKRQVVRVGWQRQGDKG